MPCASASTQTPASRSADPDHPRREEAQALGEQPVPVLPLAAKDAEPAAAVKSFLSSYPGRVLVAADSPGRREALMEVMQAAGLMPEVVSSFATLLSRRHPREAGHDRPG